MITVNPIKFNNIKPITFGEGNLNNMTPNVGILALQNPNAKVNFEKDMFLTQKADAVQANPLKAFAYKIIKTYKYAIGQSQTPAQPLNSELGQKFSAAV